ncbi:MAG: 50S ribosomal protein L6 [Deltaproteobacteria bacterium]|nr:50S ribosomal protein L6 [Deltaproteobacteria bacterium]MBI4795362.1 50S ribosomal protein L6 [Deltaproteobacteria bacterium]
MSRIGKKPIPLPQGVKVQMAEGKVMVTGPQGKLDQLMPPRVGLEIGKAEILVKPQDDSRLTRSYWGLARTLVANMITGASQGFTRVLELAGTGYKVEAKGQSLVFSVGYSKPVDFPLPKGITAQVEKANRIELKGFDKELLGQTVAVIRRIRPPDAYKGKGIKNLGEVLRRKVGKAGGR